MRKLTVLAFVCVGAAAMAGCCTHRATLAEAPPVCSPIPCGGGCGCPQVTQGVPAYSDGAAIGVPVITTPGVAPSLSPAPGATIAPSLSPTPSGPPGAYAPGPTTFAPGSAAPTAPPATSPMGNIPPSNQ